MTTRRNGRHIVLGLGMLLALGACSTGAVPSGASAAKGATPAASPQAAANGAGDPAGHAWAATDACALLIRAEVEAAFGESMLAPASTVDHGDASCAYTHEAGGLDLNVAISSSPSSAAAMKQVAAAYGGASSEVAGVGDAAFQVAGILEFVKGTTLVTMGTGDGPAIISVARFHALAATAAGRV